MITYIFGAAKISDYSFLEKIDFTGSFIICADGGIEHIKRLKLVPDVVLGDFDSSSDVGEYKEKIVFPKEKDDTDLGLALKYAADNKLINCVAIGCLGGRLDHTYASICLLKYAFDLGVSLSLKDEYTNVYLVNKYTQIKKEGYKYVSVFPFGSSAEGVTLTGFKYPLDNATLTMNFPIGVSNELICNEGSISVEKGHLVVMEVKE